MFVPDNYTVPVPSTNVVASVEVSIVILACSEATQGIINLAALDPTTTIKGISTGIFRIHGLNFTA